MRDNNKKQLSEDNYHTIFSYLPLTSLIVFSSLNKTLQKTVKKLIQLSEQNTSIFSADHAILDTLQALEQQANASCAQEAKITTIRELIRPLVDWLYNRIQQQKSLPFNFSILTISPHTHHSMGQYTKKSTKLLFSNQYKISEIQPADTETTRTKRINRSPNLSATGPCCTLYTKERNHTLSIRTHKGREDQAYINKDKLRHWEKTNAIQLKSIISGVNSFVLITEEGDAYGVGINHNNMFYSKHNNKPLHTPKKIPLPEDCKVKKVALSKRSMAIIDDKGNLYTCGNINAHLNPEQELIDDPVNNATPLMVSGNQKFIEVSIASEHLIALSDKHRLWGLGRNTHNQIGLEESHIADAHAVTRDNASTIEEVNAGKLDHNDHPVRVHTDKFNSFFTTKKGHVFACGWNLFNILGLPQEQDYYPFTKIPTDPEKFFTQAYSYSEAHQDSVFSVLETRDRELFWSGQWRVANQAANQTVLKQEKHRLLSSNQEFNQSLLARDWRTVLSPT